MSSLKLIPGDEQFLQDYAHAIERESLLTAYIRNDRTEIMLLTQKLERYKAEIAKFSDENFGLWVWVVVQGVLIGALLSGLMYGWVT